MRFKRVVVVGVSGALLAAGSTSVRADAGVASPTGVLSQAEIDPASIALAFLTNRSSEIDLAARDTQELEVSDVVSTEHNGTTHVYVQQQRNGLDIFGAIVSVAVSERGRVVNAASSFVPTTVTTATPVIDAVEAAQSAARALRLEPTSSFVVVEAPSGDDRAQTLSDGGISRSPVPARLLYQQVGESDLRLAWELTIETIDGQNAWQIRIDAMTGRELDRNDLIISESFAGHESHGDQDGIHDDAIAPDGSGSTAAVNDVRLAGEEALRQAETPSAIGMQDGSSYEVFPQPVEAPSFAAPANTRTIVNNPADPLASPFGWHDTNGVAGAESTLTVGNNVSAYTDRNNDNVIDAGSQPDGSAGIDFGGAGFELDLGQQPSTYKPAAVTNLFYWNNIAHDFLYAYGFDEAAGNFQQNNDDRGGVGGDAVFAEAQDSADLPARCDTQVCTRNNANFFTPVDGLPPRMQMYVFDDDYSITSDIERDGSFDNGIILHEYGHGLSNRLTGGPSQVGCLSNDEQAGEGWSDYLSLVGTMRTGDVGAQPRGIGTFALGQPTTGSGVRAFPYSTDMTVDPRTYDVIKTAAIPHGVGSVFAAMLWDMTWALIEEHGFDTQLARGTGGNNIATQLVIDGMKLQRCSPGFVDARDAILAADSINNAGANTCIIWKAFAKRGLGFSADQGNPSSRLDGTQAFDLPPSCQPLGITATANVSAAQAGGIITYDLTVVNNDALPQTGVVVSDQVPAGTTYVTGSAACGGDSVGAGESGGVVTFTIDTLDAAASRSCTFSVLVDDSPATAAVFSDGFEAGTANWTADRARGLEGQAWTVDTSGPRTGTNAIFAPDPADVTDLRFTLNDPVTIGQGWQFEFWHRFDTESGFDGGVVEISTDNGTSWIDLGSRMVRNGYNTVLSRFSPTPERAAFGSYRPRYERTVIDLTDFADQNARFRFRATSDDIIGAVGWWVDDVSIVDPVAVSNTATVASTQHGRSDAPAVVIEIVESAPSNAPTSVSGVAGNAQASVSWTAPVVAPGAAIVTGYTVTSSPGSLTCSTTGATSCTVTGLTNGTPYTFTVIATTAAGASSPSSASASVTPSAPSAPPPPPPTSPTTTAPPTTSPPPPPPAPVTPDVPPGFTTIVATRVLDTRDGTGFRAEPQTRTSSPEAGRTITIPITSTVVPDGATAVVVNVTATRAQTNGWLVVHDCDSPRPPTSNANFVPGVASANLAITAISARGTICLYTSAAADLIVDVFAYTLANDAGSSFTPTVSQRLLDTRIGTQPAARTTTRVALPAGDAHAVSVTAARAIDDGYLTVHDCSAPRPNTSTVNFGVGVTAANLTIVTGAELCVYTSTDVDILVDHHGTLANTTINQTRVVDTRTGGPAPAAGTTIEVPMTAAGNRAAAAFVNVTTTQTQSAGYLSLHSCDQPSPATSNINTRVGSNVANLAIVAVGGRVCITTTSTTHIVIDLVATQP